MVPGRFVLAWLAAFALLVFAPRLTLAGEHAHPLERTNVACAACLAAHSPAALPAPVAGLAEVASAPAGTPFVSIEAPAPGFAIAAPLACGPPSAD